VSERFAGLVLVVVAVFAAAQLGVVHSQRSEASALRRRLGDVQARCASSELGLKKELQAARVRVDWLQAMLDRRSSESVRIRAELAAARKALELSQISAHGAQAQLDELHGALDGAPGALRVELVPSGDLTRLIATATNASGAPVEVLEVSGLLWLDGRTDGSGYSAQGTELASGDSLELFEYNLFAGEPEGVRSGAQTLRAGLCFVWVPVPDAGEWLDIYWFEYQADSGELALVRRDGAPLDGALHGCDLQAASPPW
jgi:hypothetical protein